MDTHIVVTEFGWTNLRGEVIDGARQGVDRPGAPRIPTRARDGSQRNAFGVSEPNAETSGEGNSRMHSNAAVVDSDIYRDIFSTSAMREAWSDRSRIQYYLDFEKALV